MEILFVPVEFLDIIRLQMKKSSLIYLKQMELGPIENFIYFLGDRQKKEIAVIDPAWDVDFLCQEAQKEQLKITSVLLTHGHPDHVNGLAKLLAKHDVPAYISTHELSVLKPHHKNLQEIKDNTKLKIGDLEIQCIHTPGHSPGGQCFLTEGHLIAGDTIFIDGCGRCDLPGSDAKQMYKSLYEKIMKLPDETLIFPGHNYGPTPSDTLAHQKQTNPYLTCHSLEEFLQERMGFVL